MIQSRAGIVGLSLVLVGMAVCLSASTANATSRQFTYSYQSQVIGKGNKEIEVWSTWRRGRSGGLYNRFDERLEFEIGLTKRLQTALYLNTSARTRDTSAGRESSFEFKGLSSEWKYNVLDAVEDPVGLALYGEVSGGPSETEFEGKIIIDKRVGKFLAALNVVGEHEWEFENPQNEHKSSLELDAGISYSITDSFSLGLEIRNDNEFPHGTDPVRSTLFAGPVASYDGSSWWVTLTALPQIAALKGRTGGALNLATHERFEARLLFGFYF